MRAIDFENHFYAPGYLEAISTRTEPPYYLANSQTMIWQDDGTTQVPCPQGQLLERLVGLTDMRIKEMDEAGIDVAALSPGPGLEYINGPEAIDLAKQHNDYTAEMMAKYPGRFIGTACLPICDVDASAKEMERCVKDLGFVGWHTHSNYGPLGFIDDERYEPLLAKCAELGSYVYIHPTVPSNDRYWRYGYSFCGAGLGFTVDVLTTTTALICSGVFDRCENLHVLMGHLGEAIPFLLQRMDWGLGSPRAVLCMQKRRITDYFKENIWVTTSGRTETNAFKMSKEVLGIDRILIGTDYPYGGDNRGGMGNMMEFLNGLDLTEAERKALYYENGERLLGKSFA